MKIRHRLIVQTKQMMSTTNIVAVSSKADFNFKTERNTSLYSFVSPSGEKAAGGIKETLSIPSVHRPLHSVCTVYTLAILALVYVQRAYLLYWRACYIQRKKIGVPS